MPALCEDVSQRRGRRKTTLAKNRAEIVAKDDDNVDVKFAPKNPTNISAKIPNTNPAKIHARNHVKNPSKIPAMNPSKNPAKTPARNPGKKPDRNPVKRNPVKSFSNNPADEYASTSSRTAINDTKKTPAKNLSAIHATISSGNSVKIPPSRIPPLSLVKTFMTSSKNSSMTLSRTSSKSSSKTPATVLAREIPAKTPVKRVTFLTVEAKTAPAPKKPQFPPAGDLVIQAIRGLGAHPRKGSSMAAIKRFMVDKLGTDVQDFVLIQRSVSLGDVLQTRGFGGTARFTLPGMEARRKRGQVGKEKEAAKEPRITAGEETEDTAKEPGMTAPDEAVEKSVVEVAECRAGLEEQLRKNRPMTRSRLMLC